MTTTHLSNLSTTKTLGVLIGHFEPFHLGQMRDILYALGQVETLHIIITPHPNPNPCFKITLQDKARWLQMACRDLPFVTIHLREDLTLPIYEDKNIDIKNTDITQYHHQFQHLLQSLNLPSHTALFVHENHPLTHSNIKPQLTLPIISIPIQSEFNSSKITQNPVAHWQAIHPEAKASYTKTVAIVGGESSGKTTLIHKLANYYGANYALEMGRLYVGTDLGGNELALQYADYAPIAIKHANAIRQAKHHATAPITLVDTDFVTTQAFCEEYEGRTHPFISACIDEFRFDHTIFLANNTPWIDDGMRSLGSEQARSRFEQRLYDIFTRHNIQAHRISSPNYHERFQQAIDYINQHIYQKHNT